MSTLDSLREYVKPDLLSVNAIILESLGSEVPLIREITQYILDGGGKRLRPTLVILCAQLFDFKGTHHYELAAVVELIHTATLLHDDVVDHSDMRRGKATANQVFGNEASVLVGDFLYSRAFQLMVHVGHLPVLKVLAHSANVIAEGEVMQLTFSHNLALSEARYLETIQLKTAALFEAAAQVGGLICERSAQEITALGLYGRHLGIAFQLIDDALDYGSSSQDIGKNIGDDFAEGKVTLPLIYAMANAPFAQQEFLRSSIHKGSVECIPEVLKIFASVGAMEYTHALAKKHIQLAINALAIFPDSPAHDVLVEFAEFSVSRSY
jgi:octaprenyl-diphosphate synthase